MWSLSFWRLEAQLARICTPATMLKPKHELNVSDDAKALADEFRKEEKLRDVACLSLYRFMTLVNLENSK